MKNNIEEFRIEKKYTQVQLDLLEMINFNGSIETADEIMFIHDIALYHSECSIDEKEKTALYQLRLLSDLIRQIPDGNSKMP